MALFRINEDACNDDQACGKIGLDNDNKKGLYSADEYDASEEQDFVGAGDSKETSKVNIPAALAAKTAGGVAAEDTEDNGVNNVSEAYSRKEVIQLNKSRVRNQLKKVKERGLESKINKHAIHGAIKDKINSLSDDKVDRSNKILDARSARNRAKFFSKY